MMLRHGFFTGALLTAFLTACAARGAGPLAVLPIRLAPHRVFVPVSLNGSNDLFFMLDTGFSMTMIHPSLAGPLQLRRAGEITIAGIAGEERAPTYEGAVLDLGGVSYAPRRVAALASDGGQRRRRDGILGSGLFRNFVVEIDFVRKQMSLYAPTNFSYAGKGEIIPLRFPRGGTVPIVNASLFAGNDTNGALVHGEFEIDTGCDSGVCVANDFAKTHHLLDHAATSESEKIGVGGGTATRSGSLPLLQLGSARIEQAQADFFLEGSPTDPGLAGHIGITALNRFKVILDYSRRRMILEKP